MQEGRCLSRDQLPQQRLWNYHRDGFDAANLHGSILVWVDAGMTKKDAAAQPTKRVHTYGRQWALLAKGYEAVY